MNVSIIETTGLGDRSYLITEGDVAVVVDPQRDIDRVLDARPRARRPDHPRPGNPHPQRLRHRRPGTRRTSPEPNTLCPPETTSHTERRAINDGDVIDAGPIQLQAVPHPRPHPSPHQLRPARRQRHGCRRFHRRVHAARHHRTH